MEARRCRHVRWRERALLFSSDYPYWSPSEGIAFLRENLAAYEQEAVLAGNAARLLGLELGGTRVETASMSGRL